MELVIIGSVALLFLGKAMTSRIFLLLLRASARSRPMAKPPWWETIVHGFKKETKLVIGFFS